MLQRHAQGEERELGLGRGYRNAVEPDRRREEVRLQRQAEALDQAVAGDDLEVAVQVQQPPPLGVERKGVEDARMADPGGGARELEAGFCRGDQKGRRILAVHEKIEIVAAVETVGEPDVALPVTIADAFAVQPVDQDAKRLRAEGRQRGPTLRVPGGSCHASLGPYGPIGA